MIQKYITKSSLSLCANTRILQGFLGNLAEKPAILSNPTSSVRYFLGSRFRVIAALVLEITQNSNLLTIISHFTYLVSEIQKSAGYLGCRIEETVGFFF